MQSTRGNSAAVLILYGFWHSLLLSKERDMFCPMSGCRGFKTVNDSIRSLCIANPQFYLSCCKSVHRLSSGPFPIIAKLPADCGYLCFFCARILMPTYMPRASTIAAARMRYMEPCATLFPKKYRLQSTLSRMASTTSFGKPWLLISSKTPRKA